MNVVFEACKVLKLVLQARAPYDTGNLAVNSIRISTERNAVLIGGVDIAEYARCTNEAWTSERWHGKQNPNEGWVQRAVREAAPLIQKALSGKYTREELDIDKEDYRKIMKKRNAMRKKLLEAEKEQI